MTNLLCAAKARTCELLTGALRASNWWACRTQLLQTSLLLLLGTLCTNVSLVVLSVSFTHVIKTCEPLFTVVIVYCMDGKLPTTKALLSELSVRRARP